MIHTSRQLKALIRNKSAGNNAKATTLIRNYIMERFLERVSQSAYNDKLILKGGMLVASMVGLDNRSTMDIDATLKNQNLSLEDAQRMIGNIINIPLDDGVTFTLRCAERIMDEAEYPGIRIKMDTALDTMRTPLKIDISTGDVITPGEIEYQYQLMFEERTIQILAYNLETVLAEKLETIISRSVANTRMRDFYDLMILCISKEGQINYRDLKAAFMATSRKRDTENQMKSAERILDGIEENANMREQWEIYKKKFEYAAGFEWEQITDNIRQVIKKIT